MHLDELEHLPDDDLDVFVVDRNTLAPVDTLNLIDQVPLHVSRATRLQKVVRVDRAAGQLSARFYLVAFTNEHAHPFVDLVGFAELAVLTRDGDAELVLFFSYADHAVEFGDRRFDFGFARLDEFDHAGQTLGDVAAGSNAAGVKGTHGELSTGFADRLCGDDADSFTQRDRAHQRHIHAVARLANTGPGLASDGRTQRNRPHLGVVRQAGVDGGDVFGHQHRSGRNGVVAYLEVERHMATVEAHIDLTLVPQTTVRTVKRHVQIFRRTALGFAYDDLVSHVDEFAGQVARVGGAERGICAPFASAVRREKVFQNRQAFTKVCADR